MDEAVLTTLSSSSHFSISFSCSHNLSECCSDMLDLWNSPQCQGENKVQLQVGLTSVSPRLNAHWNPWASWESTDIGVPLLEIQVDVGFSQSPWTIPVPGSLWMEGTAYQNVRSRGSHKVMICECFTWAGVWRVDLLYVDEHVGQVCVLQIPAVSKSGDSTLGGYWKYSMGVVIVVGEIGWCTFCCSLKESRFRGRTPK